MSDAFWVFDSLCEDCAQFWRKALRFLGLPRAEEEA